MENYSAPLSDDDILNLYQNKSFDGAFSGPITLQKFLFTDFGEHISTKRLYGILKKSPDYLQNLRPVRRFPRRHYQVYSFGQLLEADLGFMKKYKTFNYFLVVIDAFSWKIWARPLVTKSASVIQRNLISILDSIDSPITELATDFGKNLFLIIITLKEQISTNDCLFRWRIYWKQKVFLGQKNFVSAKKTSSSQGCFGNYWVYAFLYYFKTVR